MPIVEGSHSAGRGGQPVDDRVEYRVEYEVAGNVVRYTATFGSASVNATHEGQFDFDPSKLGAAAAVDAFMQNHIGKADFDIAP